MSYTEKPIFFLDGAVPAGTAGNRAHMDRRIVSILGDCFINEGIESGLLGLENRSRTFDYLTGIPVTGGGSSAQRDAGVDLLPKAPIGGPIPQPHAARRRRHD